MIVLVCGGRDFQGRNFAWNQLDDVHALEHIQLLVHGAASGADSIGAQWADRHGVQQVACPANWGYYDQAAGPVRNKAMLKLRPQLVIAFLGGNGTADMVKQSKKAGIPVWEPYECSYEEFLSTINPLDKFTS